MNRLMLGLNKTQLNIRGKLGQFFIAVIMLVMAPFALADDDHPAQKLVVDSTTMLIDIMRTDGERIKSDEAYLTELINKHVVPNLDFQSMTKLAVAKAWRNASGPQRTELVTEFKKLLLNTYTNAVTQYSGESIEFQPFRAEKKPDRAVVRSVFKQAGGGSIPVLYKLRDRDGWLIYDIEVDQISLVTSYRTAFANEIEKGGIEGLLATLKEKNAGS